MNLEVIWLLKKLQPDFKTICDFRRDNHSSFKSVSAQFLSMCSCLKLISGKFIAVDGTVIKASNNPSKSWTNRRLLAALKSNLKKIEDYLSELEKLDSDSETDVSARRTLVQEKLDEELSKKAKLADLQKDLKGKSHISFTDPDCRSLYKNGKSIVGYNVQSAVDSESHLMLAAEVTSSGRVILAI